MHAPALNYNLQSEGFDASHVLAMIPRYSHSIRSVNESREDVPVALLLPRGLRLCAAEFSVLQLKRFFLPVDPANPPQRIQTILEDSSADIVVVDETTRHLVRDLARTNVVDLSEISIEEIEQEAPFGFELLNELSPDDLAYMIYTSGSTGQPKGVPVHWAALDNHNHWFIKEFGLRPDDRSIQLFSPGFDVSIQDIFPVIRSGASLYPASKELLTDPYRFIQWIEDNQLTILSFPTALWHTLVPVLAKRPLPKSVRLVLIGGEQVNPGLVDLWFSSVDSGQVRLVNMYGPTEATIASTFCELSPQQTCAIGKPIDNVQAHLLDEESNLVTQSDVPGEIALSGAGIANGYWNRPEQTRNSFFRSEHVGGQWSYRTGDIARYDARGDLIFCGRKDNQVKVRGFRIELNEVALAVSSHPDIADAVVTRADQDRDYLIGFVVTAGSQQQLDRAKLKKDLRDYLQRLLPEYMIPTAFHFCSQFPVTVCGKVDTAKLLRTANRVEVNPPEVDDQLCRNETQRVICQVWKEVLGHFPNSLDATFEGSGGDSLSAMSFVLRLEKKFDLKRIGLTTLAIHNTVETLAAHVDDFFTAKQLDSCQPLVTHLPSTDNEGKKPCLILFHPGGGSGYLYHDLIDEPLLKNFSVVIVESPFLTGELPATKLTVSQIAQKYFLAVAQHLVPGQEVVTAGYSFGGLLAWEIGLMLRQKDFLVRKVINIDQPLPVDIRKCGIVKRLSNWMVRFKYPRATLQDMRRAKKLHDVRKASKRNAINPSHELVHLTKVEDFHQATELNYAPPVSDLKMVLIRGEIFLAKFGLPQDYGWSKVATSLNTVCIPGSHSTLFHGRFIGALRRAFYQAIGE